MPHRSSSSTRRVPLATRAAALGVGIAAAAAGLGGSPAASAATTARPGLVAPAPEVGRVQSVPGYASATGLVAQVGSRAGSHWDVTVHVPVPAGSTAVYGDWDGDGAQTPGLFAGGTWTLWNVLIGKLPSPAMTVGGFGAAGDVPVVGDWDGDGRTDLGVFRAGTFYLRTLRPGGTLGPTQRLAFGVAGDVPVVGDWDGDGRTDLGVRRGAEFFFRGRAAVLQPAPVVTPSPSGTPSPRPSASASRAAVARLASSSSPSAPTSPRGSASPSPGASASPSPAPVDPALPGIPAGTPRLAFGTAGDSPVAGDWDGDGKDTVGVVRGSSWLLRDDLLAGPPTRTRVVVRSAGDAPLPWRAPTSDGQSCPFVAARTVAARHDANAGYVVPPRGTHQPMTDEDVEGKARAAVGNAERFFTGAGYTSQAIVRRPYPDLLGYWGPLQTEYAIRLPAMRAASLAVGLSTQTWDTAALGVDPQRGREYVDWLVRTLSCEHAAFTPGGWGYGWQTAHWAMYAGLAAWLDWDQLAPQEREYAATMVVAEADHQLTLDVPYQFDLAGQDLAPGDTKAEEDSWNAAELELAVAMMPQHPRAGLWRRKAVDYELASFATPGDAASGQVVNGLALSQRLRGTNADADGVVINQGVHNPDYFETVQQDWWAAAFARLAGKAAPEAATYGAQRQWDVMTTYQFPRTLPDGTSSPTTVYQPDGSVFFPEGTRWGTLRRAQFASLDAFRLLTTRDPLQRDQAWTYLGQHLDGELALQARQGTGQTYEPGEDTYPGREEYAAAMTSMALLAVYIDAWMPVDTKDTATYAPLPKVAGLQPASGVPALPGTSTQSAGTSAAGLVGPVGAVAASPELDSP
ncbi:VCBS repeat protein [Motilibacter rhizosphaerae]|uniref:VCBS repeat protein n=1 Tax=Motilibacter rhizosphaerae TaxID=598652 RepID=A0A4Q7NB61_9ACTN|nr:VCBS repeat-containing protein [Motilibacter rhizosphaerae]RZS80093.1 VCBS repeat protein [Motilibacter rhizosphaerae]